MRKVARWIRDIRPLAGGQRGQMLVILVFAIIGLVTLVGIVTDGALLYVNLGHLRRAVDAAAVSAANQYREGREIGEVYEAVRETLQLQLPGVHNARIYWCNYQEGAGADAVVDMLGESYDPHDPELCATDLPRKRMRVEGELPVRLVFLSVIWRNAVIIKHDAESEAAVLNMVLLMDTSESMAYDTCNPTILEWEPEFFACLEECRANGDCQPFDTLDPTADPSVRSAAWDFVDQLMRDDVDQVSVYHFDKTPVITQSVESYTCEWPPTLSMPITLPISSGVVISLTTDKQAVLDAIEQGQGVPTDPLNVYIRPAAENLTTGERCESPTHVGGNWGEYGGTMQHSYGYRWASTNIGGGLREAVDELDNRGSPDAAIWIIVLLSDGAANATDRAADSNNWWTCPSPPGSGGPDERDLLAGPFCRDAEETDANPTNPISTTVTRHCPSDDVCIREEPWYTNPGHTYQEWSYDADDYARDIADLASSKEITVYTIGFGPKVLSESQGRADAGERLLRYIADVGDDGDLRTAPCGSNFYWDPNPVPVPGTDCGNYYYAPDAERLNDAFEDIVSRVFSRLTR